MANSRLTTVLGVLLFAVAAILLTSAGGAGVVAAPFTLTLMFVVVTCHPTRAFRVAGAVIGGLTAAELTWGLLYVVVGEVRYVVWLVFLAVAVGAGVAFLRVGRAA